ncbi:MAG: Yip1 family protein [Thermacetogeniaceae bacterium]
MWEYLVGVIAEPGRALREVAEKKLWKEGLLLVVVLALLNGAVSLATANSSSANLSDPELARFLTSLYNPAVFLPFILVTAALSWFLSGAIYYGFSRLFKGTGTLAGMLAGLGFAMTPYLLSVPLSALALLLGQTTASLVGGVAGFVAGLWILALNVLAIRESQQLDTGPAIGVMLITIASFFVLALIIGILIAIIVAIAAFLGGSIPS